MGNTNSSLSEEERKAMDIEKNSLFETTKPSKALAIMAIPTIASQMIILLYNLADTWFMGRTNNPYMIGASSLALTIYYAETALANVFGVGGGSLMVRLTGKKNTEDARKVASYSVAVSAISALVFSLLVLVFMEPLLSLLGASENTMQYGKEYVLTTTVIGGIPTVMSMSMSQLLRNAGYSKEAGIGVGLGSLLNVALDPLFMFVLLPEGNEVIGAGIATMLSNVCSFIYFIVMFVRLQNKTVIVIPRRIEKISREYKRSLYTVGIPAAFAICLFDIVTILFNRICVSYGDIELAAMGIVLKLERIPVNTGLGICLGMVPLIAYNYGAGNFKRMDRFFLLSGISMIVFSCVCTAVFWIFAEPAVTLFIADEATVTQGALLLRARCFALPLVMIGYLIVNYMNAVDKGNVSFILAIIRHIVLLIPVIIIMNYIWALEGMMWSQLVADCLNVAAACVIYYRVDRKLRSKLVNE